MEASQAPLLLSGDTLVILCPWLIQKGRQMITPEGRWLDLPHGRRGEGKRVTEDQRVPSLLKSGRATVRGDCFSALPARLPRGESGQEAGGPTVSTGKFRLLEFSTRTDRETSSHRQGWSGSAAARRLP